MRYRKLKFLAWPLAVLFLVPADISTPLAYAAALKKGTPVPLRVTQVVSSETSHIGDLVNLEVVRDVTVDGVVVIEAGTAAEGEVVSATDRGFLGEAGHIGIAVKNTTTVDRQDVFLRSTLHREGKDKQTLSLILGLVLCFLFLFMKGEEAEIMPGSEIKSYVDNDVVVASKPTDLEKR